MTRRRKSNQLDKVLSSTCKRGDPCVSLMELELTPEAYGHVWQDLALTLQTCFLDSKGLCALLGN